MTEIWKDIQGYEGYYQISNMGNVKSLFKNKLLHGDTNSAGYKRILLYYPNRKRFFIHRLVAFHFCKGFEENLVVNHKDGNKQNNIYTNLEWVTKSENDLHAYYNGLRKNQFIPTKPKYRIRVYDINTGETLNIFENREQFSEYIGCSTTSIQNMLSRGYFGRVIARLE